VAPLLLVAYYSFLDNEGAISLYNFEKFCTSVDTINTFIYSIGIAMMTTLICILIGYPAAYFMANSEFGTPKVMAMLFILPMWINILLRTLSTVALFDFMKLPLDEGALIFGMVYNFLPFMIYPIYNTMQKMDKSLIEAAQDLGANRYRVFRDVIMPLSVPGVYSGIVMVFMPTISTFAVSELLTMNKIKLFGTTIQENINAGMLNYGAALSLIMLIIIGLTSFFGSDDDESNETGGLL
jgi:spermidine/putrescine transport system permease protein